MPRPLHYFWAAFSPHSTCWCFYWSISAKRARMCPLSGTHWYVYISFKTNFENFQNFQRENSANIHTHTGYTYFYSHWHLHIISAVHWEKSSMSLLNPFHPEGLCYWSPKTCWQFFGGFWAQCTRCQGHLQLTLLKWVVVVPSLTDGGLFILSFTVLIRRE